jgi:ABC-type nitrate/sulfonate/bicarbonate transport system permease component
MSGWMVLARKHSTLLGFVLLALLWEMAGQRHWVGDGALPAPSATVPPGALMRPWLLTLFPSSATKPPEPLAPAASMATRLSLIWHGARLTA